MVKNFSISVADWIYETYLVNLNNRSKFLEEMIIKGSSIVTGEYSDQQKKLILAARETEKLNNEIKQLKATIGSLKHKLDGKKYPTDNEKYAQAILNRGLMG